MLRKNIWRRMRYRRENKQLVLQHHRRGRNTSVETSDLASNQTELHAAASLQQRKLRSSSSMITNSTGPTGGTIKIIEMDAAVGASLDVGDDGTIHDTAHLDGVMPTVVGTVAESTDNNNNNSTDGTSDDTTTASAAAAAVAAVAASLADEAAVEAAVAAAESHFHLQQQQQQQLDDEVVDIVISESDVMSAAAANVTTALDEAAIAAAVAVAAAVVASTSTTAATSLDHIMAPDEESTSNAVTNTKNIELIDNEVDMDDQRVAV